MGLLRLAMLGDPEVFHDGSRLTFSLRKAQALLLYLAVEGGVCIPTSSWQRSCGPTVILPMRARPYPPAPEGPWL